MAHSRRAIAPHLRNTQCRYVCPCRKVALARALHPDVPKLRQKILAEIRVEVERVRCVPLSRAVGVAAIDFASWWPDGGRRYERWEASLLGVAAVLILVG